MPEAVVEKLHQEYQTMFPHWNWGTPITGGPEDYLEAAFEKAHPTANPDPTILSAKPLPGSMEAMFAMAFRCGYLGSIDPKRVIETRLYGWGLEIGYWGDQILELEDTFSERLQERVDATLTEVNNRSSERYKNMKPEEVRADRDQIVVGVKEQFLNSHKTHTNYCCEQIDSAEARLFRIVTTYCSPDDPWQTYFSERPTP